jgi:hypothetical protein
MIDNTMALVGLDYSMTGPAMTVCVGDFHINNCRIYYLTDTIKYQGIFCDGKIEGHPFPEWKSDVERFYLISAFFTDILSRYTNIKMNIEGYAMGAKGRVFHIGEHTGIMKFRLLLCNIPYSVIAPTQVKQLATGKGNSDKNIMYNSFVKETGLDLRKELDYTKTEISSPIGDVVDSYYICKALT